MNNNRWIQSSCSIYAALLKLYPSAFRASYATPMLQVFSDECRTSYQQRGILGLFRFWLRILPDLGYTAIREHLTTPGATWGLMEPVPNAPLPWKGVLLVLLPGLVYLVSQIAQLTGQPWYLTVYYRGAFLLIIPVLIVWAVTRRFPLWGLIPIGLLYKLVQEIWYPLFYFYLNKILEIPLINSSLASSRRHLYVLMFLVVMFTIAIVILAGRYLHRHKQHGHFWIWLGAYLLLSFSQMILWVQSAMEFSRGKFNLLSLRGIWNTHQETLLWDFYNLTALLLLVFIGTLFTRRHGFHAILIMVGYVLPTMLVGIPFGIESLLNPAITLAVIIFAVLAYRILISLVAPIWMTRMPSQADKKRVIIISIVLALSIHAVMQFYQVIFNPQISGIEIQWALSVFFDEGKLLFAFLLGVTMYQDGLPESEPSAEQLVKNTAFENKAQIS